MSDRGVVYLTVLLLLSCGSSNQGPGSGGAGGTGQCTPNCSGKTCGDNGCGGSCGGCSAGQACQNGRCATSCTPNCGTNVCGSNGCGGSCGSCPSGSSCDSGRCVSPTPTGTCMSRSTPQQTFCRSDSDCTTFSFLGVMKQNGRCIGDSSFYGMWRTCLASCIGSTLYCLRCLETRPGRKTCGGIDPGTSCQQDADCGLCSNGYCVPHGTSAPPAAQTACTQGILGVPALSCPCTSTSQCRDRYSRLTDGGASPVPFVCLAPNAHKLCVPKCSTDADCSGLILNKCSSGTCIFSLCNSSSDCGSRNCVEMSVLGPAMQQTISGCYGASCASDEMCGTASWCVH